MKLNIGGVDFKFATFNKLQEAIKAEQTKIDERLKIVGEHLKKLAKEKRELQRKRRGLEAASKEISPAPAADKPAA